MAMPMSTSSVMDMSMPSSTSSPSGMGSSMSSGGMQMTFFTSTVTPLWSPSWTPSTDGQYAATCIFLIVLSIIFRFLLALRPVLENNFWTDGRQYQIAYAPATDPALQAQDEEGLKDSNTTIRTTAITGRRPRWQINPAAGRATYELVIAGCSYLLMLAVMTMNVGYFMSILAGVWLGAFILGGRASDNQWNHH